MIHDREALDLYLFILLQVLIDDYLLVNEVSQIQAYAAKAVTNTLSFVLLRNGRTRYHLALCLGLLLHPTTSSFCTTPPGRLVEIRPLVARCGCLLSPIIPQEEAFLAVLVIARLLSCQ